MRGDGFSLVEVIVAMVLLSIGLLAVAGNGLLAMELLRDAEEREEIVDRSTALIDSLLQNRISGAGIVQLRRHQLDWTARARAIHVRVELRDGSVFELEAAR